MSRELQLNSYAQQLRCDLEPLLKQYTPKEGDYLWITQSKSGAEVLRWGNRYHKAPFCTYEIRWSEVKNTAVCCIVECIIDDDPDLDLDVDEYTRHEFVNRIERMIATVELANVVEAKFRHWYPQFSWEGRPDRWFFHERDVERSRIPNDIAMLEFAVGGSSMRLTIHHVDTTRPMFLATFAADSKQFEYERLPGGPCVSREQWLAEISYHFERYPITIQNTFPSYR